MGLNFSSGFARRQSDSVSTLTEGGVRGSTAEIASRTKRLDNDWRDWISSRSIKGTPVKVWNTLRATYKVSDFLGWQRAGLLILNPDFQRGNVWKVGAKSYLIDTILRGLPIPIIFLRDKKPDLKKFETQREVVDGQQRLRTVIAFIAPNLLPDFDPARDKFKIKKEHNEEYQGKSFEELPEEIRNQFLDYQFSVDVFPSDTDDREVKQIFQRMNSSGYKLNDQELRNAEWFGKFKTVAEELATEQLNRWREWNVFTADNLVRMKEVELSSELIIMMLSGISEKNDKVISGAYEKYDEVFPDSDEVKRRFRSTFDFIDTKLDDAVKAYFSKRSLFYPLFAAIYESQYGLIQKNSASDARGSLKKQKPNSVPQSVIDTIRTAGERIIAKTAPHSVIEATIRRIHVVERKRLMHYLLTLK